MESKSERTRRFIIEKSAALFNTKGYHGTSMSDILQATGLAKGGVYGHFKSKEEIVTNAFEHAFYQVSDNLTLRIKKRTHALEKLEEIIRFYSEFLIKPPVEGGCPILNYSAYSLDEVPAISKLLAKATKILLDSLYRIVSKGQKYGQIKPEIDAKAYAEIIFSRIQGALMLAKATENDAALQRVLDALRKDIQRDLPI